MSGIGSPGMQVLQDLLTLVANPELHQQRIKQLNDAEASAKSAADYLSSAQQQLETQRAALEADKSSHAQSVAEFASQKAVILAKENSFDERARTLATQEAAVGDGVSKLAAAQTSFSAARADKQNELTRREQAVESAEARQKVEQARIDQLQSELTSKLAKLKALVQ